MRKKRIRRKERREGRKRKKKLHRLDRTAPKVHRAERRGVDGATEEVPDSVPMEPALWADGIGSEADAMTIIPQEEGMARSQLR